MMTLQSVIKNNLWRKGEPVKCKTKFHQNVFNICTIINLNIRYKHIILGNRVVTKEDKSSILSIEHLFSMTFDFFYIFY